MMIQYSALAVVLLMIVVAVNNGNMGGQLASAAPIRAPDLRQCQMAKDSSVAGPAVTLFFNCCLPLPSNGRVVDFSFAGQSNNGARRVRRPAHTASEADVARYRKAYELMRALPADDPRSLAAQANIHCAFCNGAYKQPGASNNVTIDVHFSWLFLAWHRWYLYFHERILGSLVGDPDFSLVFWNWDNQLTGAGANVMPAMFVLDTSSSLYDPRRNPVNAPPALVRLNALSNTTNNSLIVQENLNAMYQALVTAYTPTLFVGGAYRTGTDDSHFTVINAPLGGHIENGIHNAVHFWTGDPNLELVQDMGAFSTAARDPIFYAHHSNVDRLWEVWRSIPGGTRQPPSDPDFLDAQFVFYDEEARLVLVTVRDALDTRKLGITYQHVSAGDDLWLDFNPQPSSTGNLASLAAAMGVQEVGPASTDNTQTIDLGRRLTALVRLPHANNHQNQSQLDEVLVIQGVELVRDRFVQLLVFLNLPDADRNTPISGAEFVGSFNVVPRFDHRRLFTNVRLEIGDNLRRIGIQNDSLVVITVVVKTQTRYSNVDVKMRGMEIIYE